MNAALNRIAFQRAVLRFHRLNIHHATPRDHTLFRAFPDRDEASRWDGALLQSGEDMNPSAAALIDHFLELTKKFVGHRKSDVQTLLVNCFEVLVCGK